MDGTAGHGAESPAEVENGGADVYGNIGQPERLVESRAEQTLNLIDHFSAAFRNVRERMSRIFRENIL